ncbi:MAG: response regulator [Chloroflexota bacterium]|nr:response regulator [Chloroflexota bacterium]
MSDQWRILVVEDEEDLNRSIVNSLRKDGYVVQGVASGAEAIRALLADEYGVVIGDLKIPGADDFELIQWLRLYRPHAYLMMIADPGPPEARTQALESGVISYLEKPINLHVLKEEIRRLFQQTGFSANLDSFDLLDVIQIITLSRKNIALVVNIGLEERGLLQFQNGELIWAEYGILHGEEAFFALAAHKNGTVSHEPGNEQISPNVTQPLSRLILKALQYRSKYAAASQPSSELEALAPPSHVEKAVDDSPFVFFVDPLSPQEQPQTETLSETANLEEALQEQEWWLPTSHMPGAHASPGAGTGDMGVSHAVSENTSNREPAEKRNGSHSSGNTGTITPSIVHKTAAGQRNDLPSWLTDQPTQSDMVPLSSPARSTSEPLAAIPTPPQPVAEWQPSQALASPSQPAQPVTQSTKQPLNNGTVTPHKPLSTDTGVSMRRVSSPEWQPQEHFAPPPSGPLQSLVSTTRKSGDIPPVENRRESGVLPPIRSSDTRQASRPLPTVEEASSVYTPRAPRRNNSAIVTALQTLGYSIPGFIATAIVGLDGQPIAQVSVEDLDLSVIGGSLGRVLHGALLSLTQAGWGAYEDTIITSASHHILLRLIGTEHNAFQVLITTREADPVESLEVMANVEGSIAAAL